MINEKIKALAANSQMPLDVQLLAAIVLKLDAIFDMLVLADRVERIVGERPPRKMRVFVEGGPNYKQRG